MGDRWRNPEMVPAAALERSLVGVLAANHTGPRFHHADARERDSEALFERRREAFDGACRRTEEQLELFAAVKRPIRGVEPREPRGFARFQATSYKPSRFMARRRR